MKLEEVPFSVFAAIEPDGPLDAALLFKRTGVLLSSWTRKPVPENLLPVMAATMLGSIDTLVEAVGDACPTAVFVATDARHILVTRVESQVALVLVASRAVGEATLRQEARRILSKVQIGTRTPRSEAAEVSSRL